MFCFDNDLKPTSTISQRKKPIKIHKFDYAYGQVINNYIQRVLIIYQIQMESIMNFK